jgi:hypothetical protein
MNSGPPPRRKRWVLIGGALAVAAVVAGLLVIKSQRAAYVRETLAILPEAEKAYQGGRFSDAAKSAAGAGARLKANPPWFEPPDASRIRDYDEFLGAQLSLWTHVEAVASRIGADPAKARGELEGLILQARNGAPRSQPLVDRIEPHLRASLAREREAVEAAVLKRIPEALQAYEQGTWDRLASHLEEIRKSVAALPAASRDAAAQQLAKDLKPVEDLAAPVAAMRAIADGKEEGPVKADRLRDLLRALDDPKGRDQSLRRDLLTAIARVDPETRKPVAGFKVPKESHATLAEAFSKGGSLQRIGNPDDTSVIEFQGPVHHYAIRIVGKPAQILIEVDRVRLLFSVQMVDNREFMALAAAAEFSRKLRTARHPRAFSDEAWVVHGDAPGPCVVTSEGRQAWLLLGGRLFEGTYGPAGNAGEVVSEFLAAARTLETAVRQSAVIPEEIKGPVSALLKACHSRAPPGDHLDGRFCREAVQAGYVEAQIPSPDLPVARLLREFRRTYGEVVRFHPRLEARSSDGAVVTLLANFEGGGLWRLDDPVAKTTTFSSMPRDCMGSHLAVQSVFSGRHEQFPADAEPVEIRMSHPVAGEVARWKSAGGKLTFDARRWAAAVTLGDPGAIPEHFGTGDWMVPPHAVKVDGHGQARELLLPAGALKVEPFDAVPTGPKRREAQERFLQRCSERLRSPGELHLFMRYFVQYVLDSPVTTATTLIGSSRHTGDVHQDACQTLDRRLNGRFLADCDDLAELYWNILKRQGRLAYVLGVPRHATCGVADKDGDGWVFYCVDTGPPRQLKGADLDGIVEKLLRTYDLDGSMSFDPRQMRFLFRFAGEQTRSDYYLDSRMLRDPQYADLMIRVQEYWHFGFYALGIETMSKVLETDRMPANCSEISGLYIRVGLFGEALKWTEAAVKGLESKDRLTVLSESLRVVQCLRELKRNDDAVKTLRETAAGISEVLKSNPGEADRYRYLQFSVAASLAECDQPWEGWALVGEDVADLVEAEAAADSLMSMVTQIYSKMQEAARSGTALTARQAEDLRKVGAILQTYNSKGLFDSDDSIRETLGKYGQLYSYYAALNGPEKAVAELVKPDYAKDRRNHASREDAPERLDWEWIRLSPYAYAIASSSALDKDNKKAGGPKEAIAVIRALEAALPEIRRQGSLGPTEFVVLDLRLLRCCLEMDEKGIRSVFDEMKRQGWGELYENLSRTLGGAAAYMKLPDFEKIFRLYCEYRVPRRHYYGVVYSASAAEARGHALAASKICIERFPDDTDMRREHALLQKLAK